MSMPDVHPRPVALITGAGSGIGRATALALAQHGHDVALLGRRREPLEETAGMLQSGTQSLVIPGDTSVLEDLRRAVDAVVARFDRLDVLVNNAATAPLVPIDQTTPAMIEEVMRVNACAPGWAVVLCWPVFTRQRRGCVVNVSSMASVSPFPGFFAYGASKGALNVMTRSIAQEGRTLGVRAFAVAPGAVETGMLRSIIPAATLPASKCLSPERVAQEIVRCVLGERDEDNGGVVLLPSP